VSLVSAGWQRARLVGVGFDPGEFARVELVDDVNRLGCHAECGHELIEGDEVFLRQSCPADQNVELHAEEDLFFVRQFVGEVGCDGFEILSLSEGSHEELTKFGVNGLGEIITKKAEDGIDLGLDDLTVELGEAGENLDQHRQHRLLRARHLAASERSLEAFDEAPSTESHPGIGTRLGSA